MLYGVNISAIILTDVINSERQRRKQGYTRCWAISARVTPLLNHLFHSGGRVEYDDSLVHHLQGKHVSILLC
jgi:hypothetical protein